MSAHADEKAWGTAAASEPRWPASLAVLIAAALNYWLPGKFTLGPPWLMPVIELSVLVPLSFAAPNRRPVETRWQQMAAIVLIAIVNVANVVSLFLLIRLLVFSAKDATGLELLYSSFAIWITNIIVFALWYWEIDRGGPDDRLRVEHGAPDFLFPQMITPGCVDDRWSPAFLDYVYLAFTNATAFSPADVMPLTVTAKLLMMVEASASLATIAIVASRAVGILS